MLTTLVENWPGLPRRHHGPGSDGGDARAGGALRRRDHPRATSRRSTSLSDPFVVETADGELPLPSADHRDRRLGAAARAAVGAGADRPWRVDVRHVRRLFLPRQADRGRRRRRLGDGGSDLPHAFASQGHGHPPPRHAARVEDHAGQGVREPEDRVRTGTPRSRKSRTSEGRGHRRCAPER